MSKLTKDSGKVARRKAQAPYRPYRELLKGVVRLIEQARLAAVRPVNVVLTSTYWLVGQRIVEHEQSGSERAAYGQALMKLLAQDLTAQLGRGFSERNLEMMRLFYLGWPNPAYGPFFRCLGRTMSACSPSRTLTHAGTTSKRHCKAVGRSANWIVRSPALPIGGSAAQDPCP